MTYDARKKDYAKEQINIIEIDFDYCENTFGVAPCTATGSGDSKCYNCFESCQDLPNYNKGTLTQKFCEPRSPHPQGLSGVIPSLLSVSYSPMQINPEGGLSIRSSLDVTLKDHPHNDKGVDKYVSERTYDPYKRGTYWPRMRSRHPNYQFRAIRHKTGFLVNDKYEEGNFITRHYVIDNLNVGSGTARIKAKDPVALLKMGRFKVPTPSKGKLQAAIGVGAGSATLIPTGIGSEYPASGWVCINSEVIAFTRSGDTLTLTQRGDKNTEAAEHGVDDTVQLCYYKNAQIDEILVDILTNFANYPSSFIPSAEWSSEVDTYLVGLLDGFIAKPEDGNKVLKELSEAKPHYLYWDDISQTTKLQALKAPPENAPILNMEKNIISASFDDIPEKRYSTVFVSFGQYDPTKKVDEPGNYAQTHLRVDVDSVAKYESSSVKTIYSRWINNNNKAAALQAAALIGRRFANIPREASFVMDIKDSSIKPGELRMLNHRDIPDFSGLPKNTMFQITSVAEQGTTFSYRGLEFLYGQELPEDEGGSEPDVDLVIISSNQRNINLRTIYNSLFPAPDASTKVKFVVDNGIIIGSTSGGSYSMDTGSWPAGAEVTLKINPDSIGAGKGAKGAGTGGAAENGGDFLIMNHNLSLDNLGIIGSGGGGGGSVEADGYLAGGGGGAGDNVGQAGASDTAGSGTLNTYTAAEDGTTTNGGDGATISYEVAGEPFLLNGGKGGDLGQAGTGTGAGSAGTAINRNGHTLTYINAGDIRGAVIG